MNIVIINGSPRPHGNTAAMVEAFTEGAKKAGNTVEILNIGNKQIGGCKNCDYCRTKGNGTCIQKDDMQEVYPVLKEAEMLVIASPIYYYSLTGQTHCVIERVYAWERLPKIKKSALLLSAGAGGFTSAIQTYKDAIVMHMGAKDMGIITSAGSQNKSQKKLAEIFEFAKKL